MDPNIEQKQDIIPDEKRQLLVKELRDLADMLENKTVEPTLAAGGKKMIPGIGKHKPTWNGEFMMHVEYKVKQIKGLPDNAPDVKLAG